MENINNIMQLCRLCLVKDQVNVPIFGGTNDLEGISSKISSCLPVKVAPDDSLPKKICDDCSYKLDLLYVFRNTSISSEKQLYQWLEQAGISKTTSGTISTAQSLTAPISTDPPFPSVPISTLDTVMNDTITKSEISVKQEKADSTAGSELSAEAQEYLLQQQKLPYQENFGDFNTTGTNSAAADTEEPVRKKPRRAAASKSPIKDNDSDTDMPPTKAEDDSDEDIDDPGDGGMDDDDDDDEEEEDDGLDNPEFVDVPSTSAEEQPGPSGVNKDPIAAPAKQLRKRPERLMRDRPLTCMYCSNTFLSNAHLEQHLAAHTDVRPYSCDICKKTYKRVEHLQSHKCINDPTEKHECDICGKNLSSKENLKVHRLRRHLKQYKVICDTCGHGCMSPAELRQHVNIVHFKLDKISLCNICGQSFSNSYMKRHMKRHEEGYKDKRNFKCEVCSRTFLQMFHLKTHTRRMHADNRPKHACDVCNKEYTDRRGLTRHKRKHENIKPHECKLCDKKFTVKEQLIEHIRVHTGEKPYVCKICDRGFTQRTPLRIHLRQHTGEKPYSCDICDAKFTVKSYLTSHLKAKHSKD